MKKSPWIPITTNPSRVGFYEVRGWLLAISKMHWDGRHWGFWLDEDRAVRIHFPEYSGDAWRGKM